MEVSTCMVDISIFREFASFCYNILLISAFLAFIPLILYVLVVFGITELLVFIIKNRKKVIKIIYNIYYNTDFKNHLLF